jgi:hypothetical protein
MTLYQFAYDFWGTALVVFECWFFGYLIIGVVWWRRFYPREDEDDESF